MTPTLTWRSRHHHLLIQPWGTDSIRVRANLGPIRDDTPHALLPSPQTDPTKTTITHDDGEQFLHHGRVTVRLTPDGTLTFIHSQTGQQLLAEKNGRPGWPPARYLRHGPGDLREITASFMPHDDEKFYGLGQRQHGRLDQKGCVIPLQQYNTEVNIPFLLSNRGYGFLWNNPGVGRVELGTNQTSWVMDATRGIDYYIVAGDSPAEILEKYINATGHPPLL
ncbi:MAG: hypothetical protein KDD89_15050, partial [Anaerolineales bacterium]|nr:hypothetical protein [Anaerolineales bacterium]